MRHEEKALKASMIGAFALALWGISMALVSGSGAIMLDGMFNLISAILTLLSIKISRLVSSPGSRDYPLGYFAYESLFVLVKGTSILVLVVMALVSNVKVLLTGGREPQLGLMIGYVVIAVIGCFALYSIVHRSAKKTGLDMLRAEAQAWLINALITGAIGVAFAIALMLQGTAVGWIDRYVDQILVIVLSIIFIKDPVLLIIDGFRELTLAAPYDEVVQPYNETLLPMADTLDLKHLSFDVIKTGRRRWVTIRVIPKTPTVDIAAFGHLQRTLKQAARQAYENSETEVILEADE